VSSEDRRRRRKKEERYERKGEEGEERTGTTWAAIVPLSSKSFYIFSASGRNKEERKRKPSQPREEGEMYRTHAEGF